MHISSLVVLLLLSMSCAFGQKESMVDHSVLSDSLFTEEQDSSFLIKAYHDKKGQKHYISVNEEVVFRLKSDSLKKVKYTGIIDSIASNGFSLYSSNRFFKINDVATIVSRYYSRAENKEDLLRILAGGLMATTGAFLLSNPDEQPFSRPMGLVGVFIGTPILFHATYHLIKTNRKTVKKGWTIETIFVGKGSNNTLDGVTVE